MKGIRTAIYKVDDLTKAKAWYSEVFRVTPYFDQEFYVGFSVGEYELGLLPNKDVSKNLSDNVLVYWDVDNIDQEYKRLKDMGATDYELPHNVGGNIYIAALRDLWGNIIGIICSSDT